MCYVLALCNSISEIVQAYNEGNFIAAKGLTLVGLVNL